MRLYKSSLLFMVVLVVGLTFLTAGKVWAQYPLEIPERSGLTLMVNVGPGYQYDGQFNSSGAGLGRVSLGIGDFLKSDLGVFLRFSITKAEHTEGFFPQRLSSGFGGFALQFWQNSRFFIETGLGVGFTVEEFTSRPQRGISALLGSGVTLYDLGKSNIHLGLEYSPVLIRSDLFHTVGLNIGYQWF